VGGHGGRNDPNIVYTYEYNKERKKSKHISNFVNIPKISLQRAFLHFYKHL
jgi:hypothetical protein